MENTFQLNLYFYFRHPNKKDQVFFSKCFLYFVSVADLRGGKFRDTGPSPPPKKRQNNMMNNNFQFCTNLSIIPSFSVKETQQKVYP